jgi:hypothetical protein
MEKKRWIIFSFFKNRVLLSEQEVQDLKDGLKKKWTSVSNEYQTLTHKVIDTIGLKRKK